MICFLSEEELVFVQKLLPDGTNICIGSECGVCEVDSRGTGSEATHSCTFAGDLGLIINASCLELSLCFFSLMQTLRLAW